MEELLYTDFYVWDHPQTGSQDIACREYHLPSHVSEHVDYITPGIRLRQHPRKVAEVRRRDETMALEKRGVYATNTGLSPLPLVTL